MQPETRMFSRYKLAISCMKEELRIEIDRGRFFKEMDKLFREAKTCSISPFEEKMKSRRKNGRLLKSQPNTEQDVVVDAVTEDVVVDAVTEDVVVDTVTKDVVVDAVTKDMVVDAVTEDVAVDV